MDEDGRGGLWAGLTISLLAAIAFGILWYLRGGEIDRLQAELAALRQTAASTEQRLDGELRTAQSDNTAKDRRITELENSLVNDVRRAQEAGRTAERRLQLDLDTARRRLDEAGTVNEEEVRTLRENLEKTQAALSELTGEQNRIQEEYASASQQTATRAQEINALRALVKSLEEQAAANADAIAKAERERAEAERGRSEAEQELAAARDELAVGRVAGGGADSAAAAGAESDAEAASDSARAEAEAARVREQSLNRRVQELTASLADRETDFTKRMAAARDAALARVTALEKEYAERLRSAEEELAKQGKTGTVRGIRQMQGEVPSGPSFAEGHIFGRMADGSTFLIGGGAAERMRPGMKFDVYRPEDGKKRYIGAVRVIRVLDGYSMAVSSGGGETVRLCPETGRIVMDSSATHSPFAPEKKLLDVAADDYVFDAPAVGDRLDSPFFSVSRPLHFGLEGDLAGNACVLKAIEQMGGIPVPPDAAERDFLLVKDGGDAAKRISLEHLANYLEPRPDLSCK